jgi:hypothetical protein
MLKFHSSKDFPNEKLNYKNKNIFSSSEKEMNEEVQNLYLNKFHNLIGDSFSDIELLDIFSKNNYDEEKIMNDIKYLLSIGNSHKLDDDNNSSEKNYSPSFRQTSNSKKSESKIKYNNSPCSSKNEKRFFLKDTDFSTDHENEIKKDMLLEYKKDLFEKLKKINYSHKVNRVSNDEISFNNIDIKDRFDSNNKNYINNNEMKIIELKNKNYSQKNRSPISQRRSINPNQIINKELKNKYMKEFFGQMKIYCKNSHNNRNKSPDFGTKSSILEMSPSKIEKSQKLYTYKPGFKNKFFNKQSSYDYLKIDSKVNNILISACYDNPNRDLFLRMINEKRKQNPDKIIEVLFPFPPIPQMPLYPNMYPQYNPYNPYMNAFMTNPQQYSLQNSLMNMPINKSNNRMSFENNINMMDDQMNNIPNKNKDL